MHEKRTWIIGASEDCDLVVTRETVSSRHCRLTQNANGFLLEDLKSTNGTYVDGRRIYEPEQVTPAQNVTLGQTVAMPWPDTGRPPAIITIGRADDNDIVLDYAHISGKHARLIPNGATWTIEDAGSTNGVAIGSPDNRVERAEVARNDVVYFGSTGMTVATLLEQAQRGPATGRDAAAISLLRRFAQRTREDRRQQLIVVGGVVGVAVVALMLLMMAARPGTSGDETDTASRVSSTAKDTGNANSGNANLGNAVEDARVAPEPSTAAEERKPAPEQAATPTKAERLKSSLFTVVAARPGRDEAYRIGTAWAVDANTLVTSGAVVAFLKDRAPEIELTEHYVYASSDGSRYAVREMEIHPSFKAARQEVLAAKQQAKELLAAPPQGEPETVEREMRSKLLQYREQAFQAAERQTHSDIGVLRIAEPLPTFLPLAPADISLHPKRLVRVVGLAFDKEDHFFDASEGTEPTTLDGRIHRLGGLGPDEPNNQRLLLTLDKEYEVLEFKGSPVLTVDGLVVGVYSRSTPVPPESESQSSNSNTVDAVLVRAVREVLTEQP